MNITEILQDLGSTDTASHRAAFRTLVEYPDQDTVEGASAAGLETALLTACDVVQKDEGGHLLPDQLRRFIADAIDVTPDSRGLKSYADAAMMVRGHIEWWRIRFQG